MLAELKKAKAPVETALLVAVCLFLPIVEAAKNLALLAWFVAWTVNRARDRDFGGPWRTSDTVVAIWIGGAYLAAFFAGLDGRALAKTGDVAVSAVLFWMLVRAGYGQRELRWLLGALVASTLAGLAIGYARLWSGDAKSGYLQLYSVGHVNHTAIYLAIMLGVCASWLYARWLAWRGARRALAVAVTLLVLVSLVVTTSRAAVGVGLALLLLVGLAWWPRSRGPLAAGVVAVAVTIAGVAAFRAEVLQKQMDNAAAQNVLSFRDGIWRAGLEAWKKYPWFGVGKDNFGKLTPGLVKAWRAEAGEGYDEARYSYSSHAHNLYVNTLAERGAIGFASLAVVLLAALAALLRFRPRPGDGDFAWLAWGGAASAWIVTTAIGTVNTTLHHEHGLLAALLLGLWLSTGPGARRARASA
jgi:O-antigen ligase